MGSSPAPLARRRRIGGTQGLVLHQDARAAIFGAAVIDPGRARTFGPATRLGDCHAPPSARVRHVAHGRPSVDPWGGIATLVSVGVPGAHPGRVARREEAFMSDCD